MVKNMKNENDSNLTDEKIQVDLGKEREFSQKQILCFILLGVVFILFRIVPGGTQSKYLRLLVVLIIIGGFGLLYKFTQVRKKNREYYNEQIVKKAVQTLLPDANIEPDRFVDDVMLWKLGVIPRYNNAKGSYLLEYSRKEKRLSLSNLVLKLDIEGNQNGPRTVFEGQVYTLAYKSYIPGHVRIISKIRTDKNKRERLAGRNELMYGEKEIGISNSRFIDNFKVYASSEEDAREVLTPSVIEQLLNIKDRYGVFNISVKGSEIVFVLSSMNKFLELSMTKNSQSISIENTINEIKNNLDFAQNIEDRINEGE